MGKLMNALIIALIIELAASMFITCIGVGCGEERTFLFSWVLNPQNWSANGLMTFITNNLFTLAGGAIIVGAALYLGGIEFVVFAGLAAIFFSYVKTLWILHQVIRNIGFFGGEIIGGFIATILLGGLLVYTIVAVIDFARGRD